MYAVFRTDTFDRHVAKLPLSERGRIKMLEERQLCVDPFVGKPLRYAYFREKRLDRLRIYYLVYEEFRVVLLVAVSDKKTQQETIDGILENRESLHRSVRELFTRRV